MTAQDYKISFKYGAYGSGGYTKSKPHRGNDRPCACGTLLVIGNTQLGRTGTTGKSTGCHLHTQAGVDVGVQNTVDPTPYEFKAGTVVGVRKTDTGEWGKYVKMTVNGIFIVYAHLSEVYVKVGDIVGEDEEVKPTEQDVWNNFDKYIGFQPSKKQINDYMNEPLHVLKEDMANYVLDRLREEKAKKKAEVTKQDIIDYIGKNLK